MFSHLRLFALVVVALAGLFFSLARAQDADDEASSDTSWSLEPGFSQFKMYGVARGANSTFIAHAATPGARLGIYAYDRYGNCVAWDDVGSARLPAAVAINVQPGDDIELMVEVHNLGITSQKANLLKAE